MLKLILIISLFFQLPFLFAQKSLNQRDEFGRKQGYWREYYKNGQLHYETVFRNDTIIENYISYYENGKLQCRKVMEDTQVVLYQDFSDKNYKITEILYQNEKIVYYRKYNLDGVLNYEEYYTTDTEFIQTFAEFDTVVYQQIPFQNLKGINVIDSNYNRQGLWAVAYPNGNLKYECYYRNDTIIGTFSSFYENGNLKQTFFVRKGKIINRSYYFKKDGKLKYYLELKNGRMERFVDK